MTIIEGIRYQIFNGFYSSIVELSCLRWADSHDSGEKIDYDSDVIFASFFQLMKFARLVYFIDLCGDVLTDAIKLFCLKSAFPSRTLA